jgi:vancomycin resistance protein VanJ
MRRLAGIASLAWIALLFLLLAALEWGAEAHWTLALLIFAPPWLFLLPSLALGFLCSVSRQWRLVAAHGGCVAAVLIGYIGYEWNPQRDAKAGTLTVITHNIGQGNGQQFARFVAAQNPDVMLLQDARNRRKLFTERHPDAYVEGRGEFLCVSRHLIQQWKVLPQPSWGRRPVMARFEVLFRGQPVAFYNVHLPTPRLQLNRFLGGRVLVEMMDNDDGPSRSLLTYQQWVADQRALSRAVAEVLEREPLPFIVGGDFNTPDHGPAYHRFAGLMTDSHVAAGRGWGFTFPGGAKFPANLFTPWLRIDYLFAGRGWEPVYCAPEPGDLSQHHAVVARFRRK